MQLSWSAGFVATDYSRARAVPAYAVYLFKTVAGIIGEGPAAEYCWGATYKVASYNGTLLMAVWILSRTAL